MTVTSYNVYQQITSVRLATTSNLSGRYFNGNLNNGVGATLTASSVGSLVIDGVNAEIGDRVFLVQQTNSNENGIYVVRAKGGSISLWLLERSPDFQSLEQMKVGQFFSVGAGDTLSGVMFVLVEPLPNVIGIDSFSFIDVADSGSVVGPYLLKSANLSDVDDVQESIINLGTGSGEPLTLDDSDFVGGIYQLPIPCPIFIEITITTPGNELRLPIANVPGESFSLGLGPEIRSINSLESFDVADSSGSGILSMAGYDSVFFRVQDTSTAAGSWIIDPNVYGVNSLSGNAFLISTDGSVNISTDTIQNSIDFSVSSSPGVTLQSAYDNGQNANVVLSPDRPISFMDGTLASEINVVTTEATGLNTVANYRVFGWTFIPSIDMKVTSLQYDDSLFTTSTPRDTGIYNKDTEELLGSASILQTDPLDSTNTFRTHELNNSIMLSAGVEYVFATVIPANQSSFINEDAVVSNITVTGYASGPSSSSPVPLQYPQSFTTLADALYIGSFQYSEFTPGDEVNINDSTTDDSVIFEVNSTTRSSHPAPSMTSAERLAIASPSMGDLVFDTDQNTYAFFNGTSWTLIPTNFPISPFQSIVNSVPFPNTSLGNPARYYYSIDFVINGFIALWIANAVNTVRKGYPVYFKNNSAFVATLTDGSANVVATLNPGDFYMVQLDTNTTADGTWIASNLHSSLQEAYNTGQSISISATDPMIISNPSSSIEYNNDSESYFYKILSTTQGVINAPIMTEAQRDAISSPDEGITIYNSTQNTIDFYDGSSWQSQLTVDGVIGGTNITVLNNGDGTITIDGSGSGLLNGGYAIFNISSGATTTFANSSYKPVNCTVATSSSSNINVNNDGSIEIVDDGVYDFEYVISGRSSGTQNVYGLAIAINTVAQTDSLQTYYVAPAVSLSGSGSALVVKYTYSLVAGDIVQLYIANLDTLSNDFIAQQMIGSINQNLASTATLQQAYDVGNGTIQGNQTTKPFEVKNSGGTALLTFTESAGSLTGNSSTATALQTARTIGGVSFDGTANIVPQTIQSISESSDTTCFPLFITASGSQSLQPKNNSSFSYNSLLNTMSFSGLNLNNGGAPLTSTNNVLSFSSIIGSGNYINFAAHGNIGENGSGNPFMAGNLNYDATGATYSYMTSNSAGVIEVGTSGVILYGAPSGVSGNSVTPTEILRASQAGDLIFNNLTANNLLALDGSKKVTNTTSSLSPTFAGLTLNNSGSALSGTNNVLNFPNSTLSVGNYINFGTLGNIGTSGSNIFYSKNLAWDSTAATYKYISGTTTGAVLEFSNGLFTFKTAPVGAAGDPVVPTSVAAIDSTGMAFLGSSTINIAALTASSLVATDGSKNLTSSISGLSPTFTGLNLSGLTASSLVATDGSKNLTSTVSGLSPTFTGLNLSGLTATGIVLTDGSKNLSTVASVSTYTPTIGDGTNNFSTTTANGQYYKLGHLYFVNITLEWNSKGSASAGSEIQISLPITVGANQHRASGTIGYTRGISFTGSFYGATATTATNYFKLYATSTVGVSTVITVSQASTSGEIQLSVILWDN